MDNARLGTAYMTKLQSIYGRDVFSGRRPKVKFIDIGPDAPGTFRCYIWGRKREEYFTVVFMSLFNVTVTEYGTVPSIHMYMYRTNQYIHVPYMYMYLFLTLFPSIPLLSASCFVEILKSQQTVNIFSR